MNVNRGKSGRSYERSFNDKEEDYVISLFCGIRSNFIVAKFIEAIISKRNCNPLGLVVKTIMDIMIAADEEGLLLSKDPRFVRDWITASVLSEIEYFTNLEGYSHE